MLPSLKKVRAGINEVFEILKVNDFHFYPLWHYHPQYEIMLIEKSSGIRYVGDDISPFGEKEITVLGSNIPHLFRNHPEYFQKRAKHQARATVLYFSEEFVGTSFFQMSELSAVKEMLELSKRGLSISEKSKGEVIRRLYRTVNKSGLDRLLEFVSLLQYIASEAEYRVLSSIGFTSSVDEKDVDRLNKVFDFLLKNFSRTITLAEIAEIANMSNTAFCRYFKERTNKTFICFLNELRIGHACKLMIEDRNMNITQICFETGYNNLTNFNIQFKKIKKISPMEFRNKYKHQKFYW